MGAGSSRQFAQPRPRQASRLGYRSKPKRRRGLFRRIRRNVTTQTLAPALPYRPASIPLRPSYLPLPIGFRQRPILPPVYSNYAPWAYLPGRAPMMLPAQAPLPQQQYYQPMAMPAASQVPPMFVPQSQPMIIPRPVPPPSYPMEPQWSPYVQVQPVPQLAPTPIPVYNNIPVAPSVQPGMSNIMTRPLASSNPTAARNLFTDWTGGGMISPGFLGPPL